jgi:hypothetical protein
MRILMLGESPYPGHSGGAGNLFKEVRNITRLSERWPLA